MEATKGAGQRRDFKEAELDRITQSILEVQNNWAYEIRSPHNPGSMTGTCPFGISTTDPAKSMTPRQPLAKIGPQCKLFSPPALNQEICCDFFATRSYNLRVSSPIFSSSLKSSRQMILMMTITSLRRF